MIYKMYKMIFSEKPDPDQDLSYFEELYENNGVEMVGEWINVDNPKEMYFMTGYRDEEHFKEFTETVKQDEKYQKMTESLNDIRESIEVVTLRKNL